MNEQLRYYRQKNGLKLEDVAFVLEITEIDYAAIENGAIALPLKLVVKLCRFYGIKPDDLLVSDSVTTAKVDIARPIEQIDKSTILNESSKNTPVTTAVRDNGVSDDWMFDWDKPHKKVTPKQAVAILKKHGTVITEEEAVKVLEFMDKMARLAIDQYTKEAEWKTKLRDFPEGYVFEISGYGCRICGGSTKGGWYDRFGLKCGLCQKAINQGIIPGEITSDKTLYYTEYEIDRDFSLTGKALTQWLRQGIIRARTITGENGKSKHYRIFLLDDNAGFLPPKAMLECHESVEVEKNGEVWQRSLRWYHCQEDPINYIKDYGISRYLKTTGGEPPAEPGNKNKA